MLSFFFEIAISCFLGKSILKKRKINVIGRFIYVHGQRVNVLFEFEPNKISVEYTICLSIILQLQTLLVNMFILNCLKFDMNELSPKL